MTKNVTYSVLRYGHFVGGVYIPTWVSSVEYPTLEGAVKEAETLSSDFPNHTYIVFAIECEVSQKPNVVINWRK